MKRKKPRLGLKLFPLLMCLVFKHLFDDPRPTDLYYVASVFWWWSIFIDPLPMIKPSEAHSFWIFILWSWREKNSFLFFHFLYF
jgi:hypothetical protein